MANTVVIGALVPDNMRTDVPGGVVRAFDVISGKLHWAWEPVTEDYLNRHRKADGQLDYLRGTPNVWAPISGDSERGLVFVPTGNPSPDLYGGNRDGVDAYGSSVVALDINSGKVAWHFQTVHHDVWDYDVASQPLLFSIPGVADGKPGVFRQPRWGIFFSWTGTAANPCTRWKNAPCPKTAYPVKPYRRRNRFQATRPPCTCPAS